MFYSQCNNCNERWELGTGSTCTCVKNEPVAWAKFSAKGNIIDLLSEPDDDYTPLYTTPPQRTWVGLTDEERKDTLQSVNTGFVVDASVVALAIEAKLKEKNT